MRMLWQYLWMFFKNYLESLYFNFDICIRDMKYF